ncbi:PAS domain S-box protein, partial [Petrachloros mirabilis]
RRRAEASFVESQNRLAKTQEFTAVMVTHVALDGRWLKVPPSLCKLLGYSESELLAGTFMNVTHPDDVEADWSQCQRVIQGEIKSFQLEKRYIRKDKEVVWVYLNCSGVYDTAGRLLHFLTYIKDITDRKRAEQSLKDSEKQWRGIIETVPIGIAISTVDGRILDINTAAWKILGYDSKDEFLRLAATSHYVNPADRQKRIEQIRAGNHVFEAQYKKKDGTLFWGRCTAAILSEGAGEAILINAYEDVTEERTYHETLQRTQKELQILNQRLIERDQVRTKFLSVVSHELRTPMAAIKGFIDNMLSGVTGKLNDRQSEYLRRMQASMDRLTRLIAQLLDWSRLETGGSPLLLKLLQPDDLVRGIADSNRTVAEAKHIDLRTEIETNLPPLQADPDKLEQVLWNLVGNAIKFTPERGTVTIACRLTLDGGIMFSVSDTGFGISQSDLPRVFEQFSGIRSAVPAAKGAQLGLYITKSLVEQHGGRIWVESTPEQGSCFFVQLPLRQAEGRNG